MDHPTSIRFDGWDRGGFYQVPARAASDFLRRVTDWGLAGVILAAPWVFGGRHDAGRLVLVLLIAVTAAAWFARQAIVPAARWPRTTAHLIILLAAALLVLQIIPLFPKWIAYLSPSTAQLLPLWTPGSGNPASLGCWRTLSFIPHETTKSLAMLVSYGLLFVVVAMRIETIDDVQRLMRWIAISAVAMAAFGLLHYFTTDGNYFWFYAHPHRVATHSVSGAFINRNHFAHFLVLGLGPLIAWFLSVAGQWPQAARHEKPVLKRQHITAAAIGGALLIVTLAILSSCSRGGAVALLAAGTVAIAIYWYRRIVDSRFLYGLAALALTLVGLLSLDKYDQLVHRLDDFTKGSVDDLDQGGVRRKLWAANIAAFNDRWMTGTGAGSHVEVYPVYLPDSDGSRFTHAENGYVQIASETGIGGLFLLAAGIAICTTWGVACWRRAQGSSEIRCLGAAAAGLAASLVHSIVDFVWFIPACMTVTIILAACLLRLSQILQPAESRQAAVRVLPRSRWWELSAAAILLGGWSVHVYIGPGIAAIHWARYLRASVANTELSKRQMSELVAGKKTPSFADHEHLNETMIRHLEQVVEWDPHFATAHLRLAAKYTLKFELSQPHAENAVGLSQLRDAAMSSSFSSPAEYHAWLERACGANLRWLRRAAAEARRAVALCPLQGEGYVYLAELAFLATDDPELAQAYVDQALRVRPYDAGVLYAVGDQAWRRGEIEAAIEKWKECFGDTGPHQLQIIFWLAGRVPADLFLATFQPDWRTLRHVWSRYRELGRPQDLEVLVGYAKEATLRETQQSTGRHAGQIWYLQSRLHDAMEQYEETLACLERAYACDRTNHSVRYALARALQDVGKLAEAEAHLRWCLARSPADTRLSKALMQITKQRHADGVAFEPSLRPDSQRATRRQ